MSPPKVVKPIHQEGVLINSVDVLDGAINARKGDKEESNTSISCPDAVEHEEMSSSGNKLPSKLPISKEYEKDAQPCWKKQLDDANENPKDVELELVLLSQSAHTPACLSDDGPVSVPKSIASCSSDTLIAGNGASLEEVKPNCGNSHPAMLKRKNKNFGKMTTSKKRRMLVGRHGRRKAAGGGKKTNRTCTTGNGTNSAAPTATKTCIGGAAVGNHGCQGGGGGDGGGDGDGPGHNDKCCADDSASKPASPKKKKSKSDNEMEVDGDLASSSHDIAMDTDPRSSQKQVSGGMADDCPCAVKLEEKPPSTNERAQRPEDRQLTKQFFMDWHCRINHSIFCKEMNCNRCHFVNKLFSFHLDEWKNGCTCHDCNQRSAILHFHGQICKLRDCRCKEFKRLPAQQNLRQQNIRQGFRQNVHPVLNTLPSTASLDSRENEAVIYCDDSLRGITHFREHTNFTFKQSKIVGKGGNGEVYDVIIDAKTKDKYFPFVSNKFVVKKAIVREDERKLLKDIATHPNFVKTHLVTNRADGKFKHLILMEKCDTSLREYLEIKKKRSEVLDLYEAMHYWTQILDAVVFLHNLRIPAIHKDIKASNVLLTYETNLIRAKLADFDAVKLLHNEYTQAGLKPKGTKYFSSPEVMGCHPHGRPADIYSLGMFLLELLFLNLIKTPQVALNKLLEIDRDLGKLIECCLQKDDPKQRPTAVHIRNSEAVKKYLGKGIAVNQMKTPQSSGV